MKKIKLYKQDMLWLILCIFTLVSTTVFIFTGSNLGIDSDISISGILAKEIIRSGEYFPSEYNSSAEIRVFNIHTVMIPLSFLTNDWTVIQSIAVMIFSIISVACSIYCSRKIYKNNMWLIAVPLLFCGINGEYTLAYFIDGAYLPHMIYTLFIPALYASCVNESQKIKSKKKFAVLLLLMSFFSMGGVRSLQSFAVPMVGAVVLLFILDNYKKDLKDNIREMKFAITNLLLFCAAIVIGIIGYRLISQRIYIMGNNDKIFFSSRNFFSNLQTFYDCCILSLGVQPDVPFIGISGISNLVRIVCGIFLLLIFPILQVKNLINETKTVQFFTIFSLIHVTEILVLSIFGIFLSDSYRYLLSSIVLLLFISANYIYQHILPYAKQVGKILIMGSLIVYVVSFAVPKLTSFVGYKEGLAQKRSITTYLYDKGLTYGYASYWNANNNTLLSNGDVEINAVGIGDQIWPVYWYNSRQRYTEDAFQGNTFLLLTAEENDIYLNSMSYYALGYPLYVDQFNNFWIYVYDYNISNNNFEGKGALP